MNLNHAFYFVKVIEKEGHSASLSLGQISQVFP